MRTRIKFCGITSKRDLDAAVSLGVDAVGFNNYPDSPRYVEPSVCAELLRNVPAFVTRVGLFANADADWVAECCRQLPFDLLQFHGDETEEYCQAYDRPYIKAIRISCAADLERHAYNFPSARALMLDAKVEGVLGGTGKAFDWRLARDLPGPVILAGGLTAENVGDAIRTVRPFAVDVSSGIEREKGVKDENSMKAFVAAVRAADGEPR